MTDPPNAFRLVAVAADPAALVDQARALARELGLPQAAGCADPRFLCLLTVTPARLELREQGRGAPGPVYADFAGGAIAYRRRCGGGRGQPLARAVGLKGGTCPEVLDVTAGLGRDAFVLASLGCRVQLAERSPVIAALLRDGLVRAAQDPKVGSLVRERLSLQRADGRDLMAALEQARRPEVVYLDPMYPHRAKTALPGKDMRLLRRIVGDDGDAPALLEAALGCARRRVVVKRPRLAPVLEGPEPTAAIASSNTRFDVYVIAAPPG